LAVKKSLNVLHTVCVKLEPNKMYLTTLWVIHCLVDF